MEKLKPQQIEQIRKMLDDRQKSLEEEIRAERAQQDDYVDLASEVPDAGDASFASLSLDLNNASVARDVNELNAILRTRAQIEDGSYGECLECGYTIPFERLQAQPTAERCAPCQDIYEKTHADARRGATL
jgi:RNA polymerase-binding transcription factor DksA